MIQLSCKIEAVLCREHVATAVRLLDHLQQELFIGAICQQCRVGIKQVEGQRAVRRQVARCAAQRVKLLLFSGCQEQRARRNCHHWKLTLNVEVPHVGLDQFQTARQGCSLQRLSLGHPEHGLVQVDSDHFQPLLRERECDPAGSDANLEHRTARRPAQAVIELDIAGIGRRIEDVVPLCPGHVVHVRFVHV